MVSNRSEDTRCTAGGNVVVPKTNPLKSGLHYETNLGTCGY